MIQDKGNSQHYSTNKRKNFKENNNGQSLSEKNLRPFFMYLDKTGNSC